MIVQISTNELNYASLIIINNNNGNNYSKTFWYVSLGLGIEKIAALQQNETQFEELFRW